MLSTPSIRKLLNVLRRPLTLNEPSRGVKPPVFSADSRTPVVSSASDEYSRPFSGSARVCSPVITWPRWLVSVSSSVRRGGHLDPLGQLSDLQRQVDALPRADGQPDVVGERDREAGLLGGHHVGADADRDELVAAVGVGRLRLGDAGLGRVSVIVAPAPPRRSDR